MTAVQTQPLPPGTTLARGKYTIESVLGQGGFGYVYLARDQQSCTCAIKQCTDLSSEGLMQFGHEVAIQKILSDATFVHVYAQFVETVTMGDVQSAAESLFTVMEYVPGRSLEEILEERLQRNLGPFAEQDGVRWAAQILGSLEHAHAVGVIHRDIKPGNILLLPDGGRVKVIDFGIAKIGGNGSQTLRGARGVSPGYSPPEQYAQSGMTDRCSDIYAVGATLYHLLTGCAPVDAPVRQSGQPLIRPRQHNPSLSAAVEAVILRAMQLDVAGRFQSALEMQAALQGKAPASFVKTRSIDQGQASADSPNESLVLFNTTVRKVRDLPVLCYGTWPEAIGHLQTGRLEQWLREQDVQGQQLALEIQHLRSLHPQNPNLQLDMVLRQIDPHLPLPQLQLKPAQPLVVQIEEGGTHNTNLEVTNSGRGYLVGALEPVDRWIQITPATIFCAPGQSQRFRIVLDTTELAGNPTGLPYSARVRLSTNSGNRTVVYPVLVNTTPRLVVTPETLDWGKVTFRKPLARELSVRNAGTGKLQINIQSPVSWLQITPPTITMGPQEHQYVTVELLPHQVAARGQQSQVIQLTAGALGIKPIAVVANLTHQVALSADPRTQLSNLSALITWCDKHWQDAIRMLRSGELVAAINYLCKPTPGLFKPRNAELTGIILDKIQHASALPNDNLALETVLRVLGAKQPRFRHNWRAIERQLGMGWRPDVRWFWPWWSGPGPLTFVIQNRSRGYLYGRVDSAVHWLEVKQPEFGCLAGQKQRIQIGLKKQQRRLRGLAPELLVLQVY